LFNAAPACAQWLPGSSNAVVRVECQFLTSANEAAARLDARNFSYGLVLSSQGDGSQFALTVDPDLFLNVRFFLELFVVALSHSGPAPSFLLSAQTHVVDLNTGKELRLGSTAVASSDTAFFSVSLSKNVKVSHIPLFVVCKRVR
jgi:hypothetical protein